MKKTIAISKRLRISKAQEYTLVEVLIASLVLGVAVVLSIYLIKMISFNAKVLTAQDESIGNYYDTIKNVGLCVDSNRDGKYSDAELDKCNPDSTDMTEGTLRYNIMNNLANNASLESVAREESLTECYDENKNKINFSEKYQDADSEEEKEQYLELTKKCSALRVIPDALPSQQNTEALMASLNDVFLISGWDPMSLTPSDDIEESEDGELGIIPMSVTIEADDVTTIKILKNMEKSIREFNINKATIEWSGENQLSLQAQISSYFTTDLSISESTKTITAASKTGKAK